MVSYTCVLPVQFAWDKKKMFNDWELFYFFLIWAGNLNTDAAFCVKYAEIYLENLGNKNFAFYLFVIVTT